MKILFIIIDGLGDKPIKELGDKTPLEAAETPNLDFMAKEGVCGLIEPVSTTAIPTSEEGHFSLFGYNPRAYCIKRGLFTAQGAGLKMKLGDVALRGNFASVDKKLNVIDRRAGRIKNTQPLIKALNGRVIDGIKFLMKPAGEYRVGIVLRGKNLSSSISDGDPHYSSLGEGTRKIVPLDKTRKAKFTADVLNKFLLLSHSILKGHSLNKKRKKQGKLPANYILVRGASPLQKLPSFKKRYGLKACCIAGKILYRQIGKTLGMDIINVKGANGLSNTNLKGKIRAAIKSLEKYDFIFLHIKAADSLAEDGNFQGKKQFIEKIDKNLAPLLRLKNTLFVVTSDHATCSELKRHCKEPFPILIFGDGRDSVIRFSEKACKQGKIGRIKSTTLMKTILGLLQRK